LCVVDCSISSQLLVCSTSPAAGVVHSSTSFSSSSRRSRALAAAAAADLWSHHSVVVIIDSDTVTSVSATFTYVDDPVITQVISRDSILRSAWSYLLPSAVFNSEVPQLTLNVPMTTSSILCITALRKSAE